VVSTPAPSGECRRPGYFVVVIRETLAQATRGPHAEYRSLLRLLTMRTPYHETLPSSTKRETLAPAQPLR